VLRSIGDHVSDPRHAGALEGARGVGEAAGDQRLVVRIGVWFHGGCVIRARYRATTCASLIAYAEVACALLESGEGPDLTADLLRTRLSGVHPGHLDRADLVAAAARSALSAATRSETS
jgi:hypothetical protein